MTNSSSPALHPSTRVRAEIPRQYKWDPKHIFPTWEAWETDLNSLEDLTGQILALRGKLTSGPEKLLELLLLADRMNMTMGKVGGFVHLEYDSDQRDNEINARQQKVQIAGAKLGTALSWINPEILDITWEKVKQWLDATPALEPYRFDLSEVFRAQEHILDEAGEKLLTYSSRLSNSPEKAYEMLSTADIRWPEVTLSDGKTVTITPSAHSEIMETNRNQSDRRAVFKAMVGVFKANINTYAALYDAVCQRDWFRTQARHYPTALEKKLDGNLIPLALYSNLIETTKRGYAAKKRYQRLRKRVLGLEHYGSYDGGIPLVEFNKKYPYDLVQDYVIGAVAPLGKEYVELVKRAFSGGWIDVYENDGKRSGAYSMGVYGVHPYMLLNYNDTLNYMFTVAHEIGHTIHTMLSHESQPYATAHYTIFVAEVASTMNEALLQEYLLNRVSDPLEKIALIERSIRQITGTFYAQVEYAEFEWEAHKLSEAGQPITAQILDKLFFDIHTRSTDECVEIDPLVAHFWSEIPHIYRTPYYVYQYATSLAASTKLALDIIPRAGETPEQQTHRMKALGRYLELLRSGGNAHPIEQLKLAGVDMTDPGTVQAIIDLLGTRVGQLEAAVAEAGL